MKKTKRLIALLLTVVLAFALCLPAVAAVDAQSYVPATAGYLQVAVKSPTVSSIGGEWTVIALARSGASVPEEYFRGYYASVESYVKSCAGVLHEKKYTEYSRVVLALTAIGKDPRSVAGYDLLKPLGDYDKTVWQGINGAIFALIALDSGKYDVPANPQAAKQATRQMYVDRILASQLSDGGWALSGSGADVDVTAMALTALAPYRSQTGVQRAVDRGVERLAAMQRSGGGYSSWGSENSESAAQVVIALSALGLAGDGRFMKNGKTVMDALLSYRQPDGSFRHDTAGGGNDLMATEQALLALAAAARAGSGKNSLYDMASDHLNIGGGTTGDGYGLPGKHADVKLMPVTAAGTTFPDIQTSANRAAIEALASRRIINGKDTGLFDPNANMTRAEFATIVTKSLGLTPRYNGAFSDVREAAWYGGYVGTANSYGIVNGTGGGKFTPLGTITRQEAAAMVARAARLCGMDTSMQTNEILDVLAQFGDYVTIAPWARESVAFCYASGILDESDMNVEPTRPILRCEIAQMLYNMLERAELL